MMKNLETLIPSILPGLAGAVAGAVTGAFILLYGGDYLDSRDSKRDVLRRLSGASFTLTGDRCPLPNGEPFVALNEAFVAYAEDEEVIEALEELRESGEENTGELVVALIKRMAESAGVPIPVDDASLMQPLTPRRAMDFVYDVPRPDSSGHSTAREREVVLTRCLSPSEGRAAGLTIR
ncbi:MAG: hypothetical protein OXH63_23815 [Gemmatimonadetes bacterium]|nr:hypothetical protein [Gemmatimonadota bacterium]